MFSMLFCSILILLAHIGTDARVSSRQDPTTSRLRRYVATDATAFEDDFQTLDFSVWEHEITMGGGGNWEFEAYWNNRTNSYVRDGILYLMPTLTEDLIGAANLQSGYTLDFWGAVPAEQCTGNAFYGCSRTSGAGGNILNPILSAALRTVHTVSLKYGRVEVSAKLPKGDWIWPAIWMLPVQNAYGNWPASGEIDIMESRGNPSDYPMGGNNAFGSTIHFGPAWDADVYLTKQYTLSSGSFNDDFHTFGLYWDEKGLYTYIDDESNKVLQVSFNTSFYDVGGFSKQGYYNPWQGSPNPGAPFDQEFYIIFNLAVGGTGDYFPDGMGGKCWSNQSPNAVNEFWGCKDQWYPTWDGENSALQIDWIKVTQN